MVISSSSIFQDLDLKTEVAELFKLLPHVVGIPYHLIIELFLFLSLCSRLRSALWPLIQAKLS